MHRIATVNNCSSSSSSSSAWAAQHHRSAQHTCAIHSIHTHTRSTINHKPHSSPPPAAKSSAAARHQQRRARASRANTQSSCSRMYWVRFSHALTLHTAPPRMYTSGTCFCFISVTNFQYYRLHCWGVWSVHFELLLRCMLDV